MLPDSIDQFKLVANHNGRLEVLNRLLDLTNGSHHSVSKTDILQFVADEMKSMSSVNKVKETPMPTHRSNQ